MNAALVPHNVEVNSCLQGLDLDKLQVFLLDNVYCIPDIVVFLPAHSNFQLELYFPFFPVGQYGDDQVVFIFYMSNSPGLPVFHASAKQTPVLNFHFSSRWHCPLHFPPWGDRWGTTAGSNALWGFLTFFVK